MSKKKFNENWKPRPDRNLFSEGGRWYADVTIGGKRRRCFAGYTKAAARVFLAKLRYDSAMGIKDEILPEITFGAFVEKLFEVYRRNRMSHRMSLRACGPTFNKMLLTKITREDIERYMNGRAEKVSDSSINREIAFLALIFRRAVDDDYILKSPTAKIERLKEPPPRSRVLSDDEIRRVIDCAVPHLRPILVIALSTGLRPGPSELLGIRWDNIRLDRRELTIERPKERKPKTIPLNDTAMEVLKGIKRGSSPLVFGQKSIRRAFKSACRRAGIKDWKTIRPYDLRHGFGTRLAMLGIPQATIAALMGHASTRTTERYIHATQESKRAAVALLEGRLNRQKTDTPQAEVVVKMPATYSKRDN